MMPEEEPNLILGHKAGSEDKAGLGDINKPNICWRDRTAGHTFQPVPIH